MVGKKSSGLHGSPTLLVANCVPAQNFYRPHRRTGLKDVLELDFLYDLVTAQYGKCGQKSIDPVVFFKLMLVGHLENLTSDRAIIRCCQLRLDIRYFLGYDLQEALPWHSTLSRTRQRLPESVFESDRRRGLFSVCTH